MRQLSLVKVREMAFYVEVLKDTIAHAPVEPSKAEMDKLATAMAKNGSIKPKLLAAVANMEKHAAFYPTKAVEGEQLLAGFMRSYLGFLVDTNICEVKENQMIVKRDSIYL